MRLAGPGWRFVFCGLAAAAAGRLLPLGPAGAALAALGLGFAALCAYFFRDPERPLPADARFLYAPGDGRVLSVSREGPGDIVTVRVFLSVFDVHVQRSPCAGRVDKIHYQPGGFAPAMRPEARRNERNVVRFVLEGGRPAVVVEQIAGILARRIECWAREGDSRKAGERYGMIRFGSQLAVHLPPEARPLVGPGDRVVAAVTPIAQWTP